MPSSGLAQPRPTLVIASAAARPLVGSRWFEDARLPDGQIVLSAASNCAQRPATRSRVMGSFSGILMDRRESMGLAPGWR